MQLKPTWSFGSDGTLWRILLGNGGRILAEYRDEDRKVAHFVCLDDRTGRVLWRHQRPEEPWWIGLEAVQGNRVLLHGFQTPDMPEHKGMIALDLETGEERWRNEEVTFWFAHQSRIYAYRTMFERRAGRVLDLETGEVLENLDTIDDFIPLRQLARQEDLHESIDFPEDLSDVDVPEAVRRLAEREIGAAQIVGSVEAVLRDPFLVMNYHRRGAGFTPETPRLENHLTIIDSRRSERVFSETLQTEARLPVPDSFFMREGDVFFIKGRSFLSMVHLPLEASGEAG